MSTSSPDDDATILYTSGTTGHPKGAVSTHRAVVQALMGFGCRTTADRLRNPTRAQPTDPPAFILVVPLFHVTGCVPGDAVLPVERAEARDHVQVGSRSRARATSSASASPTSSASPRRAGICWRPPKFAEHDTSSLRSVGGGGAPAPPELVRRVASSFAKASPGIGYGMTETNAYGPQNSGADYVTHPTSTGRATPILQVEVRDEDDTAAARRRAGEIWFKGPNLIRGLLEQAGRDGRVDRRRLAPQRRHRPHRRGGLRLRRGPRQGHGVAGAARTSTARRWKPRSTSTPPVHEAAVFGIPHPTAGRGGRGGRAAARRA